eukprot:4600593-Lingulodinium_polyedra.AAC.1
MGTRTPRPARSVGSPRRSELARSASCATQFGAHSRYWRTAGPRQRSDRLRAGPPLDFAGPFWPSSSLGLV